MRVLVVASYVPQFPGTGSPTRDFYLLKYLAQRHDLTLLAPVDDHESLCSTPVPSFLTFHPAFRANSTGTRESNRRKLLSQGVASRLERLRHICFELPYEAMIVSTATEALAEQLRAVDWKEYDLIHISQSLFGRLRRLVPRSVPAVLDCHNIHTAIEEREFRATQGWRHRLAEWTEWRKMRAFERKAVAKFDGWLVCSEADRRHLSALDPRCQAVIVPNGVDTQYFRADGGTSVQPDSLIFTGTMLYEPNIVAMLHFCERILPIIQRRFPAVRLYIVGQNPHPVIQDLARQRPGQITVTGSVPDVRPYIQAASVGIVPLLNGGGTRLKVLEMLSMGKPVVSTSVGCEGLAVTSGLHLLVADEPQAFASAIGQLFTDAGLSSRLATHGRALVQTRYDWQFIAPGVDDLWVQLSSRCQVHRCQG